MTSVFVVVAVVVVFAAGFASAFARASATRSVHWLVPTVTHFYIKLPAFVLSFITVLKSILSFLLCAELDKAVTSTLTVVFLYYLAEHDCAVVFEYFLLQLLLGYFVRNRGYEDCASIVWSVGVSRRATGVVL